MLRPPTQHKDRDQQVVGQQSEEERGRVNVAAPGPALRPTSTSTTAQRTREAVPHGAKSRPARWVPVACRSPLEHPGHASSLPIIGRRGRACRHRSGGPSALTELAGKADSFRPIQRSAHVDNRLEPDYRRNSFGTPPTRRAEQRLQPPTSPATRSRRGCARQHSKRSAISGENRVREG